MVKNWCCEALSHCLVKPIVKAVLRGWNEKSDLEWSLNGQFEEMSSLEKIVIIAVRGTLG